MKFLEVVWDIIFWMEVEEVIEKDSVERDIFIIVYWISIDLILGFEDGI